LELAKIYQNPLFYPIKWQHMDFVSNFAVPVVCKTQAIRDQLVAKCNNLVEIRPIVGGDMTKQPFYKEYLEGNKSEQETVNANLIHENGLYFGNNPELTKAEIKLLLKIFTSV
jgi:CDP-6-deoxy-D-xylo-4-hexulose-3-dehydrase